MKRPDVRLFLRGMSMKQLEWWRAYYELEPSLDERIDWLIASVREMVHNVAVPKKHQRPVKDFLLKFEESIAKPKQDWRAQKAMMMLALGQNQADVKARQK